MNPSGSNRLKFVKGKPIFHQYVSTARVLHLPDDLHPGHRCSARSRYSRIGSKSKACNRGDPYFRPTKQTAKNRDRLLHFTGRGTTHNYHVISGGSSIMAKMSNGAVFFWKSIVTASEAYDVAKLLFFATDVPYLTLGSSSSAVEGQRILVIGNPEGLEGTVSDGIISAFRAGRTMIQITAPVSPGSSGSPVLDESGNVIGIATQVLKEGQNLNFAISAETIRDAIAKSTVVTPSPPSVPVGTPAPSIAGSSAQDCFNRAFQEVNSGNYESGIIDYSEAIRLKPDNADAYYNRALVFKYRKQYGAAISGFTEAIRLRPGWSSAYFNMGLANFYLGQFDEAISDLDGAIRLKPDYDAYFYRGLAYDSLKQYSKAISDYTEAIRLKPDSPYAYNNRGNLYKDLKQSAKAITDLSEAIRLAPDFGLAYMNRALTYYSLERYDKAINDDTEAIRLMPENAVAYRNRGCSYTFLKQFDKAINDLDEAIRLQPDDAYSFGGRGSIFRALKQYDKAISDFTEAIRLQPDLAAAYEDRAITYDKLGKSFKAAQDRKKAKELRGR